MAEDLTDTLRATLISANEPDSNGEPANVVDGLFAIARAVERLGGAGAVMENLSTETAAHFLNERMDFFDVYSTRSESRSGFDVVLRMDGTYSSAEAAADAATGIRARLRSLTDLKRELWWRGPYA